MNAMKCEEVREQLDLLAAGECEAATKAAIEQHLGDCPACAAAYAESERLVGLLDLHWNDQRLERLRQRIEQQAEPLTPGSHAPAWEPGVPTLEHGSEAAKPTREGGSEAKARRHLRFVTPYVRRGVAIAALFLIAVGLMLWTPVWSPGPKHSEPAFTLLVHARKENMVPG